MAYSEINWSREQNRPGLTASLDLHGLVLLLERQKEAKLEK